jgi:predicted kinase
MDLRFHGHPRLGRYLAEQVSQALGDPDLLHLLPFYACYRAYVRGKVELMRSEEEEVSPEDRAASRSEARRYFQLALSYAVGGDRPAVIVVMGRVGTGKSTVAQALAEVLGWAVVSSDRVRKTLAGVSLHKRGEAAERARLYAHNLTEKTYASLHEQAVTNARTGHSTLLDATYSRRHHRDALRDRLERERIPYAFVEITAPDDVIRARLVQRGHQQGIISDARIEDFDQLAARYEVSCPAEASRIVSVSSEPAIEQTTLSVLKALVARLLSESETLQPFPLVL